MQTFFLQLLLNPPHTDNLLIIDWVKYFPLIIISSIFEGHDYPLIVFLTCLSLHILIFISLSDVDKKDKTALLKQTTFEGISYIACWHIIKHRNLASYSLSGEPLGHPHINTYTGGMWTEKSCLSDARLLLRALLARRWTPTLMALQQEVIYCVKHCVSLSYCKQKKHIDSFCPTQWAFRGLIDILYLCTDCYESYACVCLSMSSIILCLNMWAEIVYFT